MNIILAISQYGDYVQLEGKAPRKELAERYGVSSSSLSKIYRDTKDGAPIHTGYIVCGLWFEFYHLTKWHIEAPSYKNN